MGLTRDRARNIFLTVLVILSFYLSYRLWTAGREIGTEDIPTGQITRTNVSLTSHSPSDTFRPPLVALHGLNPLRPTLVSHTYSLRTLIDQEYSKRNLDQIVRSDTMSNSEYLNDLQSGSWLEFVYYEEMPLGMFEQKFAEISRDYTNAFFNRILIDIDNRDFVNFYHTETEELYVASVLAGEEIEISPFLNQENLNYVDAFPTLMTDNIIYLPSDTVDVSYRSFVIDQLSSSVYINSFFPDTSLVDVRSTDTTTRYIDLTKEVTINNVTNRLSFVRQISDPGELEPASRYTRSFDQINRFENWAESFILSSYDRETETIAFRREISGYPVFSTQDNEAVSTIQLVETGVTNLDLALRFISTPITLLDIDETETTRTVTSGSEVIEMLRRMGNGELLYRIDNIVLGYTWEESDEDSQVVNFIPEWYVMVDGTWVSYESLLELHEEDVTYGL